MENEKVKDDLMVLLSFVLFVTSEEPEEKHVVFISFSLASYIIDFDES